MPMYYFNLYDHVEVLDDDGTDLINLAAARDHAARVARELTFKSNGLLEQQWSNWTMKVHNDEGTELFSLAMSVPLAGPLARFKSTSTAKSKKGPQTWGPLSNLVAGVGFEPTTFRL